MSHQRDAAKSRSDAWSKGFLFGLYAGLSLLLLVVASLDRQHDDALHIATNIYGVQALAGAALAFWRVRKWADKPWTTPAVVSVWLSFGLALWVVGQVLWTWAALTEPGAAGAKRPIPYAEANDFFYIASDVAWLVALLKIFQSLRRRGLTEIGPFMPIMTTALALLVGAFTWINRGYIQDSGGTSESLTRLACDLVYFLLTFVSTSLAATLLMGQNAVIPFPVQQCLRWLCAAAGVNAVANIAFTTTVSRNPGDALAYYNGNWVDWLFLTAMCCWGVAALKWPVGRNELTYVLGTKESGIKNGDVYRAGEIAEGCCEDPRETQRVAVYVNSISWVLDALPGCWRVARLGDLVVGSTFLFPVSRDLMNKFRRDELTEAGMFEAVKKGPLAWECLYLADASILAAHRRRGLAFKGFKETIDNIVSDHPKIEVHCWPTTLERKGLAEKLQKHYKGQGVIVKLKD